MTEDSIQDYNFREPAMTNTPDSLVERLRAGGDMTAIAFDHLMDEAADRLEALQQESILLSASLRKADGLIKEVEGWIVGGIQSEMNLSSGDPLPTMALQMKTAAGVKLFMAYSEICHARWEALSPTGAGNAGETKMEEGKEI